MMIYYTTFPINGSIKHCSLTSCTKLTTPNAK